MALFNLSVPSKNDDHMTQLSTWEDIKDYIPKDKVVWEAFYGNGQSGKNLRTLGLKEVIHEDIDFFKNNLGDLVVSNPPFTKIKEVLTRLVKLEKPFILIMPSSKINTQYFRNIFMNNKEKIQIIIPKKRIQFIKVINGKEFTDKKYMNCNFDCFYYCWKMNFKNDIIWLK